MIRCRFRTLLGAALAVVLALPAAAAARPAPEEFAGMNIQKLIYELPPTSWRAHFDAMERSGIRLVRFDALWQRIEPEPPVSGQRVYLWQRYDPIVGELAKRGIRWLPIVAYSARWAAKARHHYASPPRDPVEYARFAGALAGRYGRDGSFWREHPEIEPLPVTDYEIWNAPNHPTHYHPRPDAAHYADMYAAARSAIREVDAAADVWVGGLAGESAPDFVRRMYAAHPALTGNVDAVAIHPYGHDARHSARLVTELRATLDGLGEETVGTPVTEVGWSTSGTGSGRRVSDAERARMLRELTLALGRSDCGVWSLMPHTWATKEQNPLDAEHWFGLVRPDTSLHASGEAFLSVVRHMRGRRRAQVALCDRVARVRAVFRKRRVTRAGRTMRRVCHRAAVHIGSSPLEGATVRFSYRERVPGGWRSRVVRRTTLADGTADVCRTLRLRQRHGRRALRLRRVSAASPGVVRDAVVRPRLPLL